MTEQTEAARLVELYSKLSEGELEKVAAESYELTDIAPADTTRRNS